MHFSRSNNHSHFLQKPQNHINFSRSSVIFKIVIFYFVVELLMIYGSFYEVLFTFSIAILFFVPPFKNQNQDSAFSPTYQKTTRNPTPTYIPSHYLLTITNHKLRPSNRSTPLPQNHPQTPQTRKSDRKPLDLEHFLLFSRSIQTLNQSHISS